MHRRKPKTSRTGFLDLSAELRNHIYDLALRSDDEEDALQVAELGPASASWYILCLKSRRLSPNILATCRQINREATPVLYGNRINCDIYDPCKFFNQIGLSIRHLRHLNLPLCDIAGRLIPHFAKSTSLITLTLSTPSEIRSLDWLTVHHMLRAFQLIQGNRQREGMPHSIGDGIIFEVENFPKRERRIYGEEAATRLYEQLEAQLNNEELIARTELLDLDKRHKGKRPSTKHARDHVLAESIALRTAFDG